MSTCSGFPQENENNMFGSVRLAKAPEQVAPLPDWGGRRNGCPARRHGTGLLAALIKKEA